MKPFTFCLLTIVFAASALGAASDSPPPAASTPSVEKSPSSPGGTQAVINLDFPGGTVAQLISVLSQSGTPAINIVGEKEDLATELPGFSLRNADPQAFASALTTLLAAHHDINLLRTGGNVYTLSRFSAVGPDVTRSFQIAACLQFQSVDDIVAAIKTAWEMDPTHKPTMLRLKYHAPTTLLLASGSSEAIEIAHNVIGSLKGSPPKDTIEPRRDHGAGNPPPASPPQPPTKSEKPNP